MEKLTYIENFEKLGFGLFVHFGLYSVVGKGEWYLDCNPTADKAKYEKLVSKFKIKKNWAKELVKTAKSAGCKYINITTRHHDGFSLFDTKGLSDYDVMHSATGRDLIKEFVDECRAAGIVPFFYHTLLDWHNPDYKNDFPAYIDYLVKSIEILCTSYGKIGGFWFDGMWDKKDADWQEDRIYATIRKHQPEAMIINNTGLSELGKVGHKEIDSVTFERGNPAYVDNSDKYRAGEMCQVLNDHWGYAKNDCNYKPISELINNLVDCRKFNCNFLLNDGLMGNGGVNAMDGAMMGQIGKWIKLNKNVIYGLHSSEVKAENADVLTDGENYYAVAKDTAMSANVNVALGGKVKEVKIEGDIKFRRAILLDNGKSVKIKNNAFTVPPFGYGTSLSVRLVKLVK